MCECVCAAFMDVLPHPQIFHSRGWLASIRCLSSMRVVHLTPTRGRYVQLPVCSVFVNFLCFVLTANDCKEMMF